MKGVLMKRKLEAETITEKLYHCNTILYSKRELTMLITTNVTENLDRYMVRRGRI